MSIEVFSPLRDEWYLTGPTASGKTGVGLELAEALGAEILSLDSMAVYRGMDVGTAKPTAAERQRVPHHLIDVVNPDEEYSLSQYLEGAHRQVVAIRERGSIPLFVGGTPLYLKALLRGVYPGPPADWKFRREIEKELKTAGIAALYDRLQQVDPLSAARLHPHDKRRIIRALEVYKCTGQPLSHEQTQFDECPRGDCRVFVLNRPRPALHRRIEQRVERMFARGLVAEVTALIERYGTLSRTARQAVGYQEVVRHVMEDRPLDETVERVTIRTRQFARRQETWFRGLSECRPVPLDEGDTPQEVAGRILQLAAEEGGSGAHVERRGPGSSEAYPQRFDD